MSMFVQRLLMFEADNEIDATGLSYLARNRGCVVTPIFEIIAELILQKNGHISGSNEQTPVEGKKCALAVPKAATATPNDIFETR